MTHLSLQAGIIHMDFPSPCPWSSNRTLWRRQLQSHWSSPNFQMRLLANEHLESNYQSECLHTNAHVNRHRFSAMLVKPFLCNQLQNKLRTVLNMFSVAVSPTQPTRVGLSSKSGGQLQWQLPGILTHTPLMQMVGSAHSLISEKEKVHFFIYK